MTATATTGRKPRNSDSAGSAAKRGQRSARPHSGRGLGSGAPEGRSAAAAKAYLRRQRRTGSVREANGPASHGGDARMLAKRIPFVALVLGILAAGMGLTLWLSTNSTGQSYEITASRQQNRDLSNQKAGLEQAVEAGTSAPVLARKAAELGMVQSSNVPRLVVGADGSVRLEGTPLAADGPAPAPLTAVRPGSATTVAPVPAPAPASPAESAPVAPPVAVAGPAVPAPETDGAGEMPVPVPNPTHGLPLVEASDPGVGQ
ncbi:hypothetical protein [Tomitella biformata]|uniref:hypothetical protein n=1 Tax=Tomitella biformata TaxID=630403 RepID=UPI00068852CA|nr:hypothetical protein [Tomitella biformata]